MGCDKLGSTSNDIVMSALLMAVRDGGMSPKVPQIHPKVECSCFCLYSSADVISASIGGFGGWSKGDALSDLINNLVSKGIALVLAAGNEGEVNKIYLSFNVIMSSLSLFLFCVIGRTILCGNSSRRDKFHCNWIRRI
jgi:hypothetical protein